MTFLDPRPRVDETVVTIEEAGPQAPVRPAWWS